MKAKAKLLVIVLAFFWLHLGATQVFGQDADLEQRIFNLRILRTGRSSNKTNKTSNKKSDPKIILAHVQEDFTNLQVTNNNLAESIERAKELDLAQVTKSVGEISEHGQRLMENLTEVKLKKTDPKPEELATNPSQLKELLSKMDKLIVDFTHNPVFKEASADDENLAAKALKDLDQIILVSNLILKSIDALRKVQD